MAATTSTSRPGLSVDAIAAAATEIVERDGVDRLSMRLLASRFGVTPMALYHHVPTKADLLVLVLERVSARLEPPAAVADPRGRALAVAVSLHRFVVDHPWVLELLTSGRYASATGLSVPDRLIGAATDAGLDDDAAFDFYRTVFHLTIGHAQSVVAATTTGPGALSALERAGDDDYPAVRRLAPRWSELDAAATVEALLTPVIDRLLPPT